MSKVYDLPEWCAVDTGDTLYGPFDDWDFAVGWAAENVASEWRVRSIYTYITEED